MTTDEPERPHPLAPLFAHQEAAIELLRQALESLRRRHEEFGALVARLIDRHSEPPTAG